LFGKATADALKFLDEQTLLDVFDGVPQSTIAKSEIEAGINVVDLLVDKCAIFPSRGQARELITGGGVSINKDKVANTEVTISGDHLIGNKYLVAQRGKKNYHLIIVQ
jgi:tyrosyl-tRNA synthetase